MNCKYCGSEVELNKEKMNLAMGRFAAKGVLTLLGYGTMTLLDFAMSGGIFSQILLGADHRSREQLKKMGRYKCYNCNTEYNEDYMEDERDFLMVEASNEKENAARKRGNLRKRLLVLLAIFLPVICWPCIKWAPSFDDAFLATLLVFDMYLVLVAVLTLAFPTILNLSSRKKAFQLLVFLTLYSTIGLVACITVSDVEPHASVSSDGSNNLAVEKKASELLTSSSDSDNRVITHEESTAIPPSDTSDLSTSDTLDADDSSYKDLLNDFNAADKELNVLYKDLRSKLSPGMKEELKQDELAWIRQKDDFCSSKSNRNESLECRLNMTKERIAVLENWSYE